MESRQRIVWTMWACSVLLALNPPPVRADSTQDTCALGCEHQLASCQQKGGKLCPREYQFCRDGCFNPAPAPSPGPERRKKICRQRCETHAAACAQNNSQAQSCKDGLRQCLKRCDK